MDINKAQVSHFTNVVHLKQHLFSYIKLRIKSKNCIPSRSFGQYKI